MSHVANIVGNLCTAVVLVAILFAFYRCDEQDKRYELEKKRIEAGYCQGKDQSAK